MHKLIIFQRREKEEKAIKDRNTAIEILKALVNKGEKEAIKKAFYSVPVKWQKKILKGLEQIGEKEILNIIEVDRKKQKVEEMKKETKQKKKIFKVSSKSHTLYCTGKSPCRKEAKTYRQ